MMTKKQIQLARHALGLDYETKSYRNRYAERVGGPDYANLIAMVNAGYATRHPGTGLELFKITDAGKALAVRPGETA